MSERFTVNLHYIENDADTVGAKFPLNTFTTDSRYLLLAELERLLYNEQSGINKIEIFDHHFDKERLSQADVGQAAIRLEDRTPEELR